MMILDSLTLQGVLVHWTPSPRSWKSVREEFVQYVVPALLPSGCPYFNRSKFTGMERALSWVGLLGAHGVFVELVQLWANPESKQKVAAASKGAANQLKELALQRIAEHQAMEAEQESDDDMAGADAEEFPPAVRTETGDFDWAEFNKATRQKAGSWAASNPHAPIVCITICLRPMQSLLQQFLRLGTDAFDEQQERAALQGCQRSFRVLEIWQGRQVRAFTADINECLRNVHGALPRTAFNESTRSFMFRLLSRAACVVEQIMAAHHRAAPFVVFAPLCGQTEELLRLKEKPCLQDELCRCVLQRYPDTDALSGHEAQAVLCSMAMSIEVDILRLESLHTASRRIIHMRSCHTWCMALEELNAEWVNRETVILREMFTVPEKAEGETGQVAQTRRQVKKKKQVRCGGPWRAFLHLNFAGVRPSKQVLQEAKASYQRLKAAGGPEWERCLQVGHIATQAGRRGLHVLKGKPEQHEPEPTEVATLEASVASEIRALTAHSRKCTQEANEKGIAERAMAEQQMEKAREHIQRTVVSSRQAAAFTAGSFQCFPGTGVQPHVARFHVPADLLAKDGFLLRFELELITNN